jgi:hypothetical protein
VEPGVAAVGYDNHIGRRLPSLIEAETSLIQAPDLSGPLLTTEGISAQFFLGDSRQTIEALAHVGYPGSDPDVRSVGQANHRGRNVVSML